jgi:endonuclease/exonuclease/phosphatase family metal-dependent hydrolase
VVLLRGMTYNVKFPNDDPPNAWPGRRSLMAGLLRRTRPHVLATQEGHYGQLREIMSDIGPGYDWIGQGREGGGRGEFCAIAYDTALLEPLDFDHFWLSATPDRVGSRTWWWGTRSVRMATWVRFAMRDPDTGARQELLWLNTHLDHESARARRLGAWLIARRLGGFPEDLPIVVSGDFNCPATDQSGPYRVLTRSAGLADSWTVTERPAPDVGTYGGWSAPQAGGTRIDWVLVRGPIAVESAGICDHHRAAEWPSDHVPVEVSLRLEAPADRGGPSLPRTPQP